MMSWTLGLWDDDANAELVVVLDVEQSENTRLIALRKRLSLKLPTVMPNRDVLTDDDFLSTLRLKRTSPKYGFTRRDKVSLVRSDRSPVINEKQPPVSLFSL